MRILIADKNTLFTRLVRLKLEKWGHRVDTAHTGTEAWELAQRSSYRMVIMDWSLEGLNGEILCRNIRSLDRSRYTYILFYSERTDHESLIQAFEAGADDYLFKPFNPLILKLMIKSGKRMLNLEDELLSIASYDPLTGLINYDTFSRFFRTHLAGARRFEESGTLLSVSLDNFSTIFKQYGYETATKLIVKLAKHLPNTIRASDLVAKVGDNTFFVLLPQTHIQNAVTVAEKLRAEAKSIQVFVGKTPVSATIEIAYVEYPQNNVDSHQILAQLKTLGPSSAIEAV